MYLNMDNSSEESVTSLIENYEDSKDDTDSEENIEPNKYDIREGKTWKTAKIDHDLLSIKYILYTCDTKIDNWDKIFKDKSVDILKLVFSFNWFEFFDSCYNSGIIDEINDALSTIMMKGQKIVPYPELLFAPLNCTNSDNIKVIILGQDPYFTSTKAGIPVARGFSFAVPIGCKNSPSLENICKNMIKFGHRKDSNINLAELCMQGCLFINSAFTTIEGTAGEHNDIWNNFTLCLLKYIIGINNKIVFLSWGQASHKLCKEIINTDIHKVITSSHPSPYSYKSEFTGTVYNTTKKKLNKNVIYPSFESTDHFGLVNKYLKELKLNKIFWNV